MQTKYILTIDQGTTSSRAILFDKKGNTVGKYQMEFTQIRRQSGFVEHNANEIYESVLECIRNVINNSGIKVSEIDCLAITNQRETAVLFDKKTGLPVCDAICWQSRQSKSICDDLIAKGYEEVIFAKTGLHINPYFSASKIRYMLDNNPKVYEKYQNDEILFGTIDTYLLYRLSSGKSFYTDHTNASRTLLYNINTHTYDDELLQIFNIKRSILPEILNTSDYFGKVEILGEKVPVCALVGDQQASLFGNCAFNEGDIKNTYGTGCFMLLNMKDKNIRSKHGLLTTIGYVINNEVNYALEGSVFIAGAAVNWLKDGIKIIESSKETSDRAYKVSEDDVILVPSFVGMGTPYWENDARGAIFGMSLQTTQEHLIKATLQGIAYQSKDVLEVMKKEANFDDISISVDGGASANDFLLQFQADIMQKVIKRPKQIETTALGACFLAGLYTKFFKDLNELKKINQTDKLYYPIIDSNKCEKLYSRWLKAVNATRSFK